MSDYTTFLYSVPSFWSGVARLVDVGGTFDDYNRVPTTEQADFVAIRNDWFAVGEELKSAAHKVMGNFKRVTKQRSLVD